MKNLVCLLILLLVGICNAIVVENEATNVITYFVLRDQTTGTVDTLVDIANLEMYYIEDQAAQSADVFVGTHGAATDAHTDGECYHIGHGVYRVDWPDAAFDGGVGTRVQLIVVDGDAGAFTEIMEAELSPPVDVITIAGTTQTGNDNGADINAILVDTDAVDTTTEMRIFLTGADTPVAKETTSATINTAVDNIETDTSAYDTDGERADAIWGVAAASYDVEDSFGNIINDVFVEDTGVYYLATLDEDTTTFDWDGTTIGVTTVTGTVNALATNSVDASSLNADAVTEIWAITMSDLAAVPAYNASVLSAINYLFEYFRNEMTVTALEIALMKDDAVTPFTEADISDDATTFTRGEFGAVD